MDEKGFLIGICGIKRRIVSKDALEKKKLLGACQDGLREFVLLLACICVDGSALPPAFIYASKSHDLQDTWLEDFDAFADQAYFAASDKGWTNEDLGVSWFEMLFLWHTSAKAEKTNCLLILDGHSSHVNWWFINKCDQNRIILGIFPFHSTHRLQLLDLKVFLLLFIAYSSHIDKLIQSSCGFSRITKRSFWSLFKLAWFEALSTSNVRSAFAAAGIEPFDPSAVLDFINYGTSQVSSSDGEPSAATPVGVRALRRQIKAAKQASEAFTKEMDLVVRAAEKLSIKNEILEHENAGLRGALIQEQKR